MRSSSVLKSRLFTAAKGKIPAQKNLRNQSVLVDTNIEMNPDSLVSQKNNLNLIKKF